MATLRLARLAARLAAARRCYSDSITYSGGQASVGQGGFYGSGGARAVKTDTAWNERAVASVETIASLVGIMDDAAALGEAIAAGDPLSEPVIERKAALKKLMTAPDTLRCIEALEMGGEPVWGLSQAERALVKEARELMLSA